MKKRSLRVVFVVCAASVLPFSAANAWEHHPLITEPLAVSMPEIDEAPMVTATLLEEFLIANEEGLVTLLAQEESWARNNMDAYAPCPDALTFQATGNANDIRERFFHAIRINPNTKTPLYTCSLADEAKVRKQLLDPSQVTLLEDTSNLAIFDFEELGPGDLVSPVAIVATASNEPDFGMDTGLFTDNNTDFGQYYGFGVQPFGNPNLDFGSQAPFHMGFYHESKIIFLFASFLKQSYPEYRIHLFKSLSEFAFDHGQDYWGWRFMGWGLHYMGDLSMPYHTTVLPGYSTFRMLIINLLDMLGLPKYQEDAVQLVSNRHMALEIYEGKKLEEAERNGGVSNPTVAALIQPREAPAYSDALPRNCLARASHAMAGKVDKAIAKYMPAQFVSDPSVELMDLPERNQLVDMIEAAHGDAAIAKLDKLQADAITGFAIYGRSYVMAILGDQ